MNVVQILWHNAQTVMTAIDINDVDGPLCKHCSFELGETNDSSTIWIRNWYVLACGSLVVQIMFYIKCNKQYFG